MRLGGQASRVNTKSFPYHTNFLAGVNQKQPLGQNTSVFNDFTASAPRADYKPQKIFQPDNQPGRLAAPKRCSLLLFLRDYQYLAVIAPQKERAAFLAPKSRVRSRNHVNLLSFPTLAGERAAFLRAVEDENSTLTAHRTESWQKK